MTPTSRRKRKDVLPSCAMYLSWSRPVSSRISRIAVSIRFSPFSCLPLGNVQRLYESFMKKISTTPPRRREKIPPGGVAHTAGLLAGCRGTALCRRRRRADGCRLFSGEDFDGFVELGVPVGIVVILCFIYLDIGFNADLVDGAPVR